MNNEYTVRILVCLSKVVNYTNVQYCWSVEDRHQSNETVMLFSFSFSVTHSHSQTPCLAGILLFCTWQICVRIAVSVFSQQMVYKLIANKVLASTKSTQNAGFNHSPVSTVCADKDINLSSAEQTPKCCYRTYKLWMFYVYVWLF